MLSFRSIALLAVIVLVLSSVAFAAGPTKAPREVAGYYWVYDDGTKPFASVSNNSDAISMLCPTWMGLKDSQGAIYAKEDPKVSEYAKAHGIKVLPLIWGSDAKSMHAIFSSISNRSRLVREIVAALDSFSYCQGVNLDFEGMYASDRYSYSNFLIQLSAKLKPKGYLLTIDVPAKSYDRPKDSWSGCFDYREIGRYCDIVMIMTYDEHWSTGGPGPVASVQMDDVVLAYATTVIPKEKIFLGLPFYGYDWPAKGKAKSYRYDTTMQLVKDKAIKLNWDRDAKTPWYTYTDDTGAKRTSYYEDKRSIAAKLAIGQKYDVGGVCIWSLGGEDPGIWDAMREFRKN